MSQNSEKLFLNRAKFVMGFLGVWIPAKDENILRKSYRIFMMSLQYLFLFFQIIYVVQKWGDLDAVSQASYLLFTQACLCFKAGRIKRLLLAFMISSQLTCGMWALKPLFDDAGSRKFPFDMWMPVTPEQVPHYYFGFAFQLLTICMSAYMYFGVDSVALSSVIFGCAQMDIIKDKLNRIEPVYGNNDFDRDTIQSKNHKDLIDCVNHHQAVIAFTRLVENAYHTYLLFQLTGSVGLICMSALRILMVDWKSMQFFSILSYLSVMITQLFVCCWCGHELSATSEDLLTAMYNCVWYEQGLNFQKDLVFVMMRMRRPLLLKAGHYIPLLRQTFVSILRMSYSYFAVLNQTMK